MDNLKLSLEKLNNPPQEVIDKRNKFFAECVELGEDVKWPHNDNTLEKLKKALYGFTRADIYKQYGYLEAKINTLEIVSGMSLDDILEKFAAGWVMVPTMPNGYFFDDELVKRHRDDSVDVLRYYPILSDPLLRTDAIVKLKFEDDIKIDFDEKPEE